MLRSHSTVAALESVTQGLARATSHRVLSPPPGSTPRYSIPFFQSISQEILISDYVLDCKQVPKICPKISANPRYSVKPEILKLKDTRGQTGAVDCKTIPKRIFCVGTDSGC